MPEARRLGRAVETLGWLLALAGLAVAAVLMLRDGPIAHQIARALGVLGEDLRLVTTLTGLVCLLPGLGLMLLGNRMAGQNSLTDRWLAALMQPRRSNPRRVLAVLICGLIAALALAAMASFWPELQLQLEP